MDKNIQIPSLRFKGFTDAWEQRELGDFGVSTSGTSIESAFSDEGKFKVISIGSYSESSTYNDQGIKVLENDKTTVKVLNKDDLTMILNDKTASGRIIGRVLLIDKDNTYVYNQRTQRIEPNSDKFDALFLYHLLNAPQMRDKIIKQAQGNTQIYVNWSTIKETVYLVPKLEEQIVLGNFFERINNLITLHQRKYDKLVNVKKALLDKLFPKNGQVIPELRFKGFTDAWEQCELRDISSSYSGGTPNVSVGEFYGGDIPFIRSGEIDSSSTELFLTANGIENSSAKMVDKGDILYAMYGATSGEVAISKINGAINQAILAIKLNDKFSSYLLVQYLKREKSRIISKYLQGGQGNLSGDIIKKIQVILPKSTIEQNQIGGLFEKIDNLITLHQRKYEKLINIKKALLQQMFV